MYDILPIEIPFGERRFPMKRFFLFTLILSVLCLSVFAGGAADSSSSGADSWPSGKTIQMIIPFGAGGDTDLHCRVLTDLVSKELGVNIVCTNVTGTSGSIGARQVLDADPDGYTILWHQTSFLMASMLGIANFGYWDFDTACTVIDDKSSFVCSSASSDKFSNFDEFVEYGKEHPGELLTGLSIGGDSHLYTLILADKLGLDISYVDLDGTKDVIPAILNGSIDFSMGIYGTYKDYIENGDFNAMCYLSDEALDGSDTQTWKDLTGESFPIGKMFGYWFPKGTPQEIIDKFNDAVEKAVSSDEFKEHCANYYVTPAFKEGADAVAYLDDYYAVMQEYKDQLLVQ